MTNREKRRIEPGTFVSRLADEDEDLCRLLEQSDSCEEAEGRVLDYLDDLEAAFRVGAFNVDRIERSAALRWIHVLKDLPSPENESIAGFSTFELLWRTARGEEDEVSEAFVDEFVHILRAIRGRSGIGKGWFDEEERVETAELEQLPASGRKAGVERSAFLDRLASALWDGVRAHPDGLDPEMCAVRAANRDRILERLGGSRRDWARWSWQAENVLKGEGGAQLLHDLVPLSGEEAAAIRLAVRYRIPWGITPYYLSLFDFERADRSVDGQVRSQVIPPLHTVRAMIEHREDRRRAFDYMRERDTSPIDRITRRYPTVVILKVCGTCPQICTYCQRNWEIEEAMDCERIPGRGELRPAIEWLEAHPAIQDVLVTGGDPLVLSNDLLSWLFGRLASIRSVTHIRIGTRTPVTAPMRIDEAVSRMLGRLIDPGRRAVTLVTHVESAAEITPDTGAAVARLKRRGVAVYNQQVLTFEASRRFQAAATRIALRRIGVDPYYTFYTKGKDEHRDYLVPIARLLQERKEEARLLPGVYRTDEPVFNVPGLGKSHLRAGQDRELIGIRADGRRVYLFHPWEKGISPVAPWPYVDVSISSYLARLEERGEDPRDYESIWYYL